MIPSNHAAPKIFFECMQKLHIALMLNDREFRQHLKTHCHFGVWIDSDEETSFAIDKPHYPVSFQYHGQNRTSSL